MEDFNRRLLSSIRVTEESALRINILEKKRKREVAAVAQVTDKVDRAHEKENNIVASIIEDTKPTVERKSIQFSQEQYDVVPYTGLTRTFLSSKRHSSTTLEELSK